MTGPPLSHGAARASRSTDGGRWIEPDRGQNRQQERVIDGALRREVVGATALHDDDVVDTSAETAHSLAAVQPDRRLGPGERDLLSLAAPRHLGRQVSVDPGFGRLARQEWL